MKSHPVFFKSIFAFDEWELLLDNRGSSKVMEKFFEKNVAGCSMLKAGILFGLLKEDAHKPWWHIDFYFFGNFIE